MAVGNPTMQRMLSERRAALGLPVRDPEESDPSRQQSSNPTNYFEDMKVGGYFLDDKDATHTSLFPVSPFDGERLTTSGIFQRNRDDRRSYRGEQSQVRRMRDEASCKTEPCLHHTRR
ncbi:hypothetical protein YC2023_059214 [Brassica napus]